MRSFRHRFAPIRNVEIGELQDTFLISAVVMILVIRLQLWATNYPQLGGGKLHIAHLLWGGVFMLVALGILLSFLGRSLRTPAAIVGGVGFGFFIDELGKFITKDNDYFFKPTAALIYVIFIALFLVTRAMQRRRGFTPHEYLVNALDITMDAARHDLDVSEKRRALELLDRADQSHPMVHPMRALLRTLEAIPNPEPPWVTRRALALRDWYFGLVARPRFARFVGWVFALWALGSLTQILSLLEGRHVSFVHVASLCSSAVAGALVVAGALKLRSGDRASAYRRFDRALLVSIFVTQIFAFVESQFAAAFGLGIDILLLVTLRAMMRGERHLQRLDTASPASASAPAGAPAPGSPAPALQPPARGPAPPRR
ncbi:MAG: hypothetical protein QOJ97_1596 [Solirubrobacteraceae bacterium]|nr:hypothetical protein [Solirubrobacteraceae bacterium]